MAPAAGLFGWDHSLGLIALTLEIRNDEPRGWVESMRRKASRIFQRILQPNAWRKVEVGIEPLGVVRRSFAQRLEAGGDFTCID